jgi:nicotinamide/nicotinate riboside kinase
VYAQEPNLFRSGLDATSVSSSVSSQPQDTLPIHPVLKVQDWDDAPGAIDWPRLRDFLRIVKQSGEIPSWHKSHDHLNEQKEVPLDSETVRRWRQKFENVRKELEEDGVRIVWGLVDGFLLYWDRVSEPLNIHD